MWLARLVVGASVLLSVITSTTAVHVNAAVCADLVGAGGVGVRVWPTIKASPETHGKRILFRLLQINWEAEELKEGDWVGVFRQDPRPPHMRPPPPPSALNATATPVHHHYWRMPHPLYWDTPYATRGTVTTNLTQPRVELSVLTKGGCVGVYVGFVRNGVCVAAECLSSHPSWLADNRRLLGLRPLRYLVLPGSHNAGSYSLTDTDDVVSTWVVCQDEDIISQLLYGIRYLDLRVAYYPDTAELLWINHDLVQWRPLVDVLNGVRGFISISPDPVILDVHRTPIGFDLPEALPLLLSLVNTTLGPHLLHNRFGPQITLSQVLSLKKQVVFSFVDDNVADRVEWVWPPIPQAWANAQLLDDLRTYLDAQMNKRQTMPQLWAAMAHLTPTLWDLLLRSHVGVRGLTDRVSFAITRWLRQRWGNKANIIASDFFRSNDIINVAIRTNLAMILCRRPERSRYPSAFRRSAAHRAQLSDEPSTTTTTVPPLFRRMYSTSAPPSQPPSSYIASVQRTYQLSDEANDHNSHTDSSSYELTDEANDESSHTDSSLYDLSKEPNSHSSHVDSSLYQFSDEYVDHSSQIDSSPFIDSSYLVNGSFSSTERSDSPAEHSPKTFSLHADSISSTYENLNSAGDSSSVAANDTSASDGYISESIHYIPFDQSDQVTSDSPSKYSNNTTSNVSVAAKSMTSHPLDNSSSDSTAVAHFSLADSSYDFRATNTSRLSEMESSQFASDDYHSDIVSLHSNDYSLDSQNLNASSTNDSSLQLEILVFTSSPSSGESGEQGHGDDWDAFLNYPVQFSGDQNSMGGPTSTKNISGVIDLKLAMNAQTDEVSLINELNSRTHTSVEDTSDSKSLDSVRYLQLNNTSDINKLDSTTKPQKDEISNIKKESDSATHLRAVNKTDMSFFNSSKDQHVYNNTDLHATPSIANITSGLIPIVLDLVSDLKVENITVINVTESETNSQIDEDSFVDKHVANMTDVSLVDSPNDSPEKNASDTSILKAASEDTQSTTQDATLSPVDSDMGPPHISIKNSTLSSTTPNMTSLPVPESSTTTSFTDLTQTLPLHTSHSHTSP